MNQPDEPISEFDLHAYVDDQLDPARRIEVEDFLARHPARAAEVMADLRSRDALRLAMPAPASPAPELTVAAGRRLARALAGQRLFARFRRVAAVAAFLAIGWFAHAELAPLGVGNSIASPKPPAFVDDALMSHRTAQLRAGLHSFHAVVDYDREELGTATGIALPDLPRDWTIRDVQLVPASSGPSVEVELAAGRAGSMSLYAVRSDAFRVINPTPLRKGDEAVVYWQMGEHAYALTGGSTAAETIAQAAEQLAASLH
ncbi:MAG: anti-sigma factor [Alphaproteobacteria bacterium]|jgi:anti-sigma factor RsiW|nr:anti-sigma factor [Alphaproteobacteria bacterium]